MAGRVKALTTYFGPALGKQSLLQAIKAGGWKVLIVSRRLCRCVGASRLCSLSPCCRALLCRC